MLKHLYLFQWATLGQDAIGHLYFEASAVVITLVLVGKAIEMKAKQSALESVAALFALKPKTVTCLRHAQEIELSIQELVSGDVLIIRSGERIGADGVIIKGDAEIDASAMTRPNKQDRNSLKYDNPGASGNSRNQRFMALG